MKVSQCGTLQELKVSSSAVAKTIKSNDETGSHEDRHGKGRPRVTFAAEDKFIRFTSLRICSPKKCFTEFKSQTYLNINHLHLSHLADALIQGDLQIGAFTL